MESMKKSESEVSLDSAVSVKTENINATDGESKVKLVFGLLKKLVGVKDISAMRLSLPASLLEPESNLEFWNYMDRPDYFISIPDGQTPLERMLRVVRWWFAKDTKWKDQRLRKPYNSVLGERFCCWWDVPFDAAVAAGGQGAGEGTSTSASQQQSASAPVQPPSTTTPLPSAAPAGAAAAASALKVTCVTEQISHHPPVSAYYYECKEKGIVGRGVDHIAARFTGTNIKVGPGSQNQGIYITLQTHANEEYNIQHPWASVTGWLSGSPYVIVGERAVITCPRSGLKCVLEYKDEPTFGKPRFAIEGKVFTYDYAADAALSEKERKEREKISKIPDAAVVARLTGQWNGQIHVTEKTAAAAAAAQRLLFDMGESEPAVKQTLPLADQHPMESRRIWEKVTAALLAKDSNTATDEKRVIEDRQRKEAAELEAAGRSFDSFFFEFKGPRDAKPGPPVNMDVGKPYLK
ncbi:hypothetical protein HDU87_003822 [Geranomyces variabilis]|uniref:Oxysterol-binding protein n=1 Tax=Geranomyces variabilis TaxID=109894 RepID=A0AAD5TKP5_9FUNG|nr:hypothetical protein HDU87_003822 [Geranomyces variabilis]